MRFTAALSLLSLACSTAVAAAQLENVPSVATPNSVFLEDLTWVEVRDAIAAGKTTAIVPTGGTEQNGPIMVLGKHNYLVKFKAGEIAKVLGNASVAPVMAYVPEGEIPGAKPAAGHMRFPGTITTPEDAYEKVLEYAARSLKSAGFLDIAFIGDSGGNQAGQKAVSEMLNKEWAATNVRVHHISDYYPGRGDDIAAANGMSQEAIGSHAGSQDVTSLMYINPGMLRFDKFALGKANDGQGHVGDPRYATATIGRLILEAQIQDGANQIKKLRVSSRQ
jgi:creatinine amidohydrolase/Fe(II)-dependent formamide hydrolase-like protein